MALELTTRRERHIGLAFTVKPAKYTDEQYTRNKPTHIAVRTDYLPGSGTPTYTLIVDGKPVANLNVADAQALGIALIGETDRV